jgi:hypothetical protein
MCFCTVGCVDAEQPDRVAVRAALHDDGVTVEHLHDSVFLTDRTPLFTEPPPQYRGGGQHGDHDHGPGADHGTTLPSGYDTDEGSSAAGGRAGNVAGPCRDAPGGSCSS